MKNDISKCRKFSIDNISFKDNGKKKLKKYNIIIKLIILAFIPIILKKIYNISISKKSNIINIKLSDNFQENNEEFDEMFQSKYIFQQNFFCLNQKIFNNTLIEDKIKLVKINLDNIKFDMFVYKTNDWVSNRIIHEKYWEYQETINVLSCLSYYSKVKKIIKFLL